MRTISCIVRVNGTGWLSHITLLIDVTHDVEQPGVGTSYGHIDINVFNANSLTHNDFWEVNRGIIFQQQCM